MEVVTAAESYGAGMAPSVLMAKEWSLRWRRKDPAHKYLSEIYREGDK